jgi:hypothetical protein
MIKSFGLVELRLSQNASFSQILQNNQLCKYLYGLIDKQSILGRDKILLF